MADIDCDLLEVTTQQGDVTLRVLRDTLGLRDVLPDMADILFHTSESGNDRIRITEYFGQFFMGSDSGA